MDSERKELSPAQRTMTKDQVDLLKRTICKDATDDELALFLQVAKRTGLDPFTRQIYMQKRWSNKTQSYEMTIGTGIDGFRLTADRSGKYQGQTEPQWCGDDGAWKTVWLEQKPPSAARIGVHKQDFREPLYAVARWATYVQTYTSDGKKHVSPMWEKMPDLMLAKVAEALALRKAFPNELSGLYAPEEMAQAYNDEETHQDVRSVDSRPEPQQIIGSSQKTATDDPRYNEEPPPMPPARYSNQTSKLTEKQIKRMFAIAQIKKWTPKYIDAYLKCEFGKLPAELNRAEYDKACDYFASTQCDDTLRQIYEGAARPSGQIMSQFEDAKRKQRGADDPDLSGLPPHMQDAPPFPTDDEIPF